MNILLNIGTNVGDKPAFSPEFVLRKLSRHFTVLQHVVVDSDTEKTVVALAVCKLPDLTVDIVHDLAIDLEQQAIAWAYADSIDATGTLTGPEAAAWGSFDRSRFITLEQAAR